MHEKTRTLSCGSVDTMDLVLKPQPNPYTALTTPLGGSDNEKEAWRKNRVIQMRLGTYLSEVCMQQRSSARLFESEETRFRHEMNNKSRQLRSVFMLNDLKDFRERMFSSRSKKDENKTTTERQKHRTIKYVPQSAKIIRTKQELTLQDRPKTSKTSEYLGNSQLGILIPFDKQSLPIANTPGKMHNSQWGNERENETEITKKLLESNNFTSDDLPLLQNGIISDDQPALKSRSTESVIENENIIEHFSPNSHDSETDSSLSMFEALKQVSKLSIDDLQVDSKQEYSCHLSNSSSQESNSKFKETENPSLSKRSLKTKQEPTLRHNTASILRQNKLKNEQAIYMRDRQLNGYSRIKSGKRKTQQTKTVSLNKGDN